LAALAARLHYAGQTQRGVGLGPVPVPKPLLDRSDANEYRLAVVGAHLSGMALNHQLIDCGARFIRATKTAPGYRLYALETTPPKPGLVKEIGTNPSQQTASIALEIWSLTPTAFAAPALQRVWPALVSQIIIVMLGSAVCGQISTEELSYAANLIQSRNFRAFEAFIVATVLYLMLSVFVRQLCQWFGRRFVFGASRG
jgi:hypothetical protein